MSFPKILIVAVGRVNQADTTNNGMLVRNLFSCWPRENLAQVFSSGDNGDPGFCAFNYRLGKEDRRFGRLFYYHKERLLEEKISDSAAGGNSQGMYPWWKRLLVDGGIYELVFSPRISPRLMEWVKTFDPDIIFAQGYNLTFSRLPVILKKSTNARLSFLTTDDWPSSLYSGQLGEPALGKILVRPFVARATRRLMRDVDVPFAFGQPMSEEYSRRYGKKFISLAHTDDPKRFSGTVPRRFHSEGVVSIVAAGTFNRYRWPLLLDLNECCRRLREHGLRVRVAVISAGLDPEGTDALAQTRYIDLFQDPGNDQLAAYLKGADLLFLGEGFDSGWVSSIQLSISSKAHLFMMSRRPILVYGHPTAGVVNYAETHKWAAVVKNRDPHELTSAVRRLLCDKAYAEQLIKEADRTFEDFHLQKTVTAKFTESLQRE